MDPVPGSKCDLTTESIDVTHPSDILVLGW